MAEPEDLASLAVDRHGDLRQDVRKDWAGQETDHEDQGPWPSWGAAAPEGATALHDHIQVNQPGPVSEPEISGETGMEASEHDGVQGGQGEGRCPKRKPARRKRPRLVPPHSRTSRFRGVYWEPKGSKWYSSISSNHKQIHLGSFSTEEEAAQAFDREAIRLRGSQTFTNFPSHHYNGGSTGSGTSPASLPQRRPPVYTRRKLGPKKKPRPPEMVLQEKDDSAANALLSLGCGIPPRPEPPVAPPKRIIAPPVTLHGQKRKRSGLAAKLRPKLDGAGRARSKYTGVYQQSRGSGWFASICVDKSMRYLGTFATEEEAARAFDQESIRLRGLGIELNLPDEADGFMRQLKEEETEAAAKGELPSWRTGHRPRVSAGPDFEDDLTDSRSDDEPPFYLQRGAPPASGICRSRRQHRPPPRQMQDFVRLEGGVATPFLEQTDSSSEDGASGAEDLPSWGLRRRRDGPKRTCSSQVVAKAERMATQVVRPKAVPAFGSGNASTARALPALPSTATPSMPPSSFLSLLAPAQSSTAFHMLPSAPQEVHGWHGPRQQTPHASQSQASPQGQAGQPCYPSFRPVQHSHQLPVSPFVHEGPVSRAFHPPGLAQPVSSLPSATVQPATFLLKGPYHLQAPEAAVSLKSSGGSFTTSAAPMPGPHQTLGRNPIADPGARSLAPSLHGFRSHASDAQSEVRRPVAVSAFRDAPHSACLNQPIAAPDAHPCWPASADQHSLGGQGSSPGLSDVGNFQGPAQLQGAVQALPPAATAVLQMLSNASLWAARGSRPLQDALAAAQRSEVAGKLEPVGPGIKAEHTALAEPQQSPGLKRPLETGQEKGGRTGAPSQPMGTGHNAAKGKAESQTPAVEENGRVPPEAKDVSHTPDLAGTPTQPPVCEMTSTQRASESSGLKNRPDSPKPIEGLQVKPAPIVHSVLATDAWLSTPDSEGLAGEDGKGASNKGMPILIQ